MISAGEFRNGVTFEMDGGVWTVVHFQHVKPGKGAAFVRTKIKNIMTGAVIEKSFSPTEKFPRAHIDTKEMQYLYNDGEVYYFMDLETYDQIPLEIEVTQTEPAAVGNTATNVTKPATVETGAVVTVPIFVNEGDKIRIDTRTGEYMERA